MNIIVIGGAGFIGSHLVDGLLNEGHKVRVFDNLEPQVHGGGSSPPDYLNRDAEFIKGDVRDRDALKKALLGIDIVFYKAAAVGVGQSMYEISRYVEVNSLGGANCLDIIVNENLPVKKIIVASSMSVYGEGAYLCPKDGIVFPTLRTDEQLANKEWEYKNQDGDLLTPIPTAESKPLHPTSVYAVTKRDHEELFLSVGKAYDIPVVALRYFNVYGPRQALSNPYTGVAAIFSSLILNNQAPMIFEDGKQTRDFVHVSDVVQSNILSLKCDYANGEVFNIGSGESVNVLQIADTLCKHLGRKLKSEIAEKFRSGDIRHCFADITKAKNILGYAPAVSFERGMKELAEWVSTQQATSKIKQSTKELIERKLVR